MVGRGKGNRADLFPRCGLGLAWEEGGSLDPWSPPACTLLSPCLPLLRPALPRPFSSLFTSALPCLLPALAIATTWCLPRGPESS